MGARSPAAAATLVNLAWNGSPEGLPRGTGATPRDAIPPYRCARAAAASTGSVRISRRVILSMSPGSTPMGLRISRALAPKTDTIGRVNWRLVALIANLVAALCLAADLTPGLREAAAALQRGEFAAAETKLRGELKLRPNDAEALSLLGVALDNQSKFSEAEPLHRRAMAARSPIGARLWKLRKSSFADRRPAWRTRGLPESARHRPYRPVRQSATGSIRPRLQGHERGTALSRPIARGSSATIRTRQSSAWPRSIRPVRMQEADAVFQRLSAGSRTDAQLSGSLGWTLAQAGLYERSEAFLTQALALEPANFQLSLRPWRRRIVRAALRTRARSPRNRSPAAARKCRRAVQPRFRLQQSQAARAGPTHARAGHAARAQTRGRGPPDCRDHGRTFGRRGFRRGLGPLSRNWFQTTIPRAASAASRAPTFANSIPAWPISSGTSSAIPTTRSGTTNSAWHKAPATPPRASRASIKHSRSSPASPPPALHEARCITCRGIRRRRFPIWKPRPPASLRTD